MDITIRTQAVFALPLTEAHLKALSILSEHHYDTRCRSMKDGIFARWLVQLECCETYREPDDHDVFTVDASFNEVDTIMKVLELVTLAEHSKLLTTDQASLCYALSRALWGVTSLANEKYGEWQATYHARPYPASA